MQPETDLERAFRTVFAWIPGNATRGQVLDYFSIVSKVNNITCYINSHGRQYVYIKFDDVNSVPLAVNHSSATELLGQRVSVIPPEPDEAASKRLYIEGLDLDVTVDELEKYFRPFGKLESMKLEDDATVQFKGFAVHVKNILTVDSDDAVPLNKMIIQKIPQVPETMPLYDILNEIQKGNSHITIVIRDHNETIESKKAKEVKYIETKLHEHKGLNFHVPGVNPESSVSQVAVTGNAGNQHSKSRPLGVFGSKKKHKCCSYCILDVLNSPIPKFLPNEEVVGVITMEDVIEELLQEEILDETDEYINIHNRIKVNMQSSQGKVSSLNSPAPSPISSSTAYMHTPTLQTSYNFEQHSPGSPQLVAPGPTPTLSISTSTSVASPTIVHFQDTPVDWHREG